MCDSSPASMLAPDYLSASWRAPCPIAKLVHFWLGKRVGLSTVVRAGAILCWVFNAVLPAEFTAPNHVIEEIFAQAGIVSLAPTAGSRRWEIRVTREGLYHIGCDQLAGVLGTPVPDLASLLLVRGSVGTEQAREVALREVDADGDRLCEAGDGDAIEFWGDPGHSRYDAGGYYWLSKGETAGLRMARRPSTAGGLPEPPLRHIQSFEQNRYYRSAVGGQSPSGMPHDHWFWTFLAFGSSVFGPVQEFPFSIGAVAEGSTELDTSTYVSVTLASLAGSHRVQASLNGVWLGDFAWQGSNAYEGVLAVPPGILQGGENRLTLALIAVQAPVAPVLVDRFALTYRLPQPMSVAGESSAEFRPLIFHTEPGSWQLEFSSAASPVTLLDLNDALRPVEVLPTCADGNCHWGIEGGQGGIYAAVAEGVRLPVDSIEEDVPSQWRTPANGAGYILITHHSLWPAAQRLASHRRSQGLRVALVDVQDIYDEFSGGQVDAEAIRAFLAYAWSNWRSPAPGYVLLLGDGTFDPHGYCTPPDNCPEFVTAPNSTLIPPYLAAVDPWLGETAADNRFAALDPNSSLPWLAIGRLPANDAAEAQAMVDKILAYEGGLPLSSDAQTLAIAFVSDNAYAPDGSPDTAGNFWQISDAALEVLRQAAAANGVQLAAQRFFLNVCDPRRYSRCLPPGTPDSSYTDVGSLTAALAGWLNGGLQPRTTSPLLHYVGHGALTGWAGQPALLQNRDTADLGLAPHLPIVVDMSCYTGYFQFPGLQSMAEAWLSSPQHGAVAVIASSGLDLVEVHAVFDSALLSGFADHSSTTMGQVFLSAKLAATAAGLPQAVETFHLFGDPAMPLWAAPASVTSPDPTGTPAVPPSQTPGVTPIEDPPPPDITPIPPTLVPGLPSSSRFFLYLPWAPNERER